MKRGEDDAGEARGSLPMMKPWWRSVGVLLGLPGLLFLLWVWRDTYSHGSRVGMRQVVSLGIARIPFSPWQVRLEYGSVVYQRGVMRNDPRDLVMGTAGMTASWRKAGMDRPLPKPWGSRWEKFHLSPWVFEVRRWGFSFGFVVAGYGVVWIGSLGIYRWWMRRRWRAAQVVKI